MKQSSGYTIRQTAELLKISVQAIQDLIKRNCLVVISDNGQWYVSVASLVAYIQRRLETIESEQKKYKNALQNLLKPLDK